MKLSIITVNFNAAEATISMVTSVLSALQNGSISSYEIIIIDNKSAQDDVAILNQSTIIDNNIVMVIFCDDNLGFAGGNNVGIQASQGEFVMLLNNDTEVRDSIFDRIIDFMESNNVSIVSPKILYMGEPCLVQYGGYDVRDKYFYRIKSPLHGVDNSTVNNVTRQTPFAHGAAMMLRRSAIDVVGLMREDYFLYFEELDWSQQFTNAGYGVWYYPFAEVFHSGSLATGRDSYSKIYYNSRNRLYFAHNNLSGITKVVAIMRQLIVSLPKNVLSSLFASDWGSAAAHIHGAYDFALGKRGKRGKCGKNGN